MKFEVGGETNVGGYQEDHTIEEYQDRIFVGINIEGQ